MNPMRILTIATAVAIVSLADAAEKTWMVVDLRNGEVSYYDYDFTTATNIFNSVEYKLSKMPFRRVEAGNVYYVQDGAATAQMEYPYYIGMFPVTAGQYKLIMNPNASVSDDVVNLTVRHSFSYENIRGTNSVPVKLGTGIGDGPLCRLNNRVNESMGISGLAFDLPTEAMWEVAVRAVPSDDDVHKTWSWFFGEADAKLGDYAFCAVNTDEIDGYGVSGTQHVIGQKLPNNWGLYDVYGNEYEWCADSWGNMTYTQIPNSQGSAYRSLRGGAWWNESSKCKSSYRGADTSSKAIYSCRFAAIAYGDQTGAKGDPYVVHNKAELESVLTSDGPKSMYVQLSDNLSVVGPIVIPTSIAKLTIDMNGGTIAASEAGASAIVVDGDTILSVEGLGSLSSGAGAPAVKMPQRLNIATGIAVVDRSATFRPNGFAPIWKFYNVDQGTWRLVTFAEIETGAADGISDDMIKVYGGNKVDEIHSLILPTINMKKNAVMVDMTVPSNETEQFFKVKFGVE